MQVDQNTQLVLALVALINALCSGAGLIIHALRVPYRESSAVEAVQTTEAAARATEAAMRLRAAMVQPPTPAGSFGVESVAAKEQPH